MRFIELCQSREFESVVNADCQQFGSFALITTKNSTTTEVRLNTGWVYAEGPRKGFSTPPLGLCDDWAVRQAWVIMDGTEMITTTSVFQAIFDRPCIIKVIENHLMDYDKACFPEITRKGMSKNGLDNVFVLKSGTYPTRNEADCDDDEAYEKLLIQSIVDQVQSVIDTLGVEIVEKHEIEKEEEHDVTK